MKKWTILLSSLFILLVVVNLTEDNFLFQRIDSISEDVSTVVTDQEDIDSAGSGRWGIWKRTLPVIEENFLLGIGPSNFKFVVPLTESHKRYGLDNVHNDYLDVALGMGIPALIVYVAFMFLILKRGFTGARQLSGDHRILLYGLLAMMISYLVKTFFNISVITVAPFFWILLGMCYALVSNVKRDSPVP